MNEDKGMNRPYQGKDIVSKILTNTFREKTFAVYGVKDVPAIKLYFSVEVSKRKNRKFYGCISSQTSVDESSEKLASGFIFLSRSQLIKTYQICSLFSVFFSGSLFSSSFFSG